MLLHVYSKRNPNFVRNSMRRHLRRVFSSSSSAEHQRRMAVAAEAVQRWLPSGGTRPTAVDALTARERTHIVESIFERFGEEDYFGEPVSHLEHALQCAALARKIKPDLRRGGPCQRGDVPSGARAVVG